MRLSWLAIALGCVVLAGCGTTKWTDTGRTATEQMLISNAMDRAVSKLDFRAIAGKKSYLEHGPVGGVTDSAYLVSTLRQHMLASGCLLMEKREEADYVVELRAGAIGTDRFELVFGIPATQIPSMIPIPMAGIPSSIPEMPLATRTEQRAVAKIAVFAYNRQTGRPVWQSGVSPIESKAKDLWVLGAGPFQRGSIYEGTEFAGTELKIPLISFGKNGGHRQEIVSTADQAFFSEPKEHDEPEELLAEDKTAAEPKTPEAAPPAANAVIPASHTAPVPTPPAAKKPAAPLEPEPTPPAASKPAVPPKSEPTPPAASKPAVPLEPEPTPPAGKG